MSVTKIDDKGRILPEEIRDRMNIRSGEEFLLAGVDENAVILRRIEVRKMFEDLIEKAKSIDPEKLEREIEEEGNRLARRNYKISD